IKPPAMSKFSWTILPSRIRVAVGGRSLPRLTLPCKNPCARAAHYSNSSVALMPVSTMSESDDRMNKPPPISLATERKARERDFSAECELLLPGIGGHWGAARGGQRNRQ